IVASKGSAAAKHQEVSVAEAVSQHVHLTATNADTHPKIVFAATHLQRIGNVEDVGPALEWRKSAIAHRPVSGQLRRTQSATRAVFRGLVQVGGISRHAVAVCA